MLQPFLDGEAGRADGELLLSLIAPYVERREDHLGFAVLRFPDGEADLYGLSDPASGLMVNNVSGDAAWSFLVEAASRVDLAILPVGCPTMVCRSDLLAHLPDALRDDAVVVTSGAQVLDVIRAA